MFWRTLTECSRETLLSTARGPLVEIRFRGRGEGSEVSDFIAREIERLEPVGVVIDLLGYRYRGGDAIGGIAAAFFARTEGSERAIARPCAIVASRGTTRSLGRLLELSRLLDIADLRFTDSLPDAREFVIGRLQTTA